MNCYQHPERPAVSFCRTCGRPLCRDDERDVYGVIYCQGCLAQRIGQPLPGVAATVSPAGHSPVLALLLGLVPGVGAVYNGQYFKAFMQVVIFAFLIFVGSLGGLQPFAGLGVAAFYFYMVIDSYGTAKAISQGHLVQDPYAAGADAVHAPWAAIVLIAIGAILLLHHLGGFRYSISRFLWPVLLIAAGIYLLQRRHQLPAGAPAPPPNPPLAPPAPDAAPPEPQPPPRGEERL